MREEEYNKVVAGAGPAGVQTVEGYVEGLKQVFEDRVS